MNKLVGENKIHIAFEISLILKGIYAVIEIFGGILTFFITKAFIISMVLNYTRDELIEDPKDFIANYLITAANNFSISTKYFVAFYLLSHGIIKLLFIIGLLRKKLWAYPSSIIVFSLFIIYQLYRYFQTFSIGLLLLTLLDLIIIFLTIHEYRFLKAYNMFQK